MGPDKNRFVRLLTTYKTLSRGSSCYEELIFNSQPPRGSISQHSNKKRTLHSIQFQLAFRVLSARLSVNVNFHCIYIALGAGGIHKKTDY